VLVCCRFLPPLRDSLQCPPTFIKEKPKRKPPLQIDNINNTRSSANAEIARVGGCYAVQGHSTLLTLLPLKSLYATSQWIILTCIVSRTVYQRSNYRLWDGVPLVSALFSVTSANIVIYHILPKTRSLRLDLCCKQYGSSFNIFYVCRVELWFFSFFFFCRILACCCLVCLCYHITLRIKMNVADVVSIRMWRIQCNNAK